MSHEPAISAKVIGEENLVKWLDALEPSVRKKILRPAITAGARPMRQAIRRGVPNKFGNLARSIDTKVKSYPQTVVAIVGPRTDATGAASDLFGRKILARPSKYAHLVNDGTRPHAIVFKSSSGATRVWMHPGTTGTHFMERAFTSTIQATANIVTERVEKGLLELA